MSITLREPIHQHHVAPGFLLSCGALHELYVGADAGCVNVSALAMMLGGAEGKPSKLWVRHEALASETGVLHPAGLAELGFDPIRLVLVRARDALSALQAGLEGARCFALGSVIIEVWGETKAYDLTASRRLALAAKASGTPVFLLRTAARPQPSAAATRWLVRAAPSRALAANAPGNPCFALTLLRARNGQEGLYYHLEWNRDARTFLAREAASPAWGAPSNAEPLTPLSRRVVPVSFDRPDPPLVSDESFSRTG